MAARQSLTVSLPADMAEMIREKVASGEYDGESAVIEEGLLTLSERDEALETWLRDEVAPTVKAFDEGAIGTVSLDEAFRHFHDHIRQIRDNTLKESSPDTTNPA
ncbi:type II toxin-antitoxin system ParD family antitoxin [Rhizobium sp. TRM95796]|uniref:ribbon-helix-helix domain-containing protein n=1 Tax=Rhizobium sp. TRM95796 TaxID=2979862 RepID=UPI0021E8B48A|nr:type II toxin-antitoxin system ParD family antitoxin [Rhizobium sp. TRM95796]MCV3766449.1 type II toxin-antitoxin system ParD family antitoxin [Rhizobium sp. TRM95796]